MIAVDTNILIHAHRVESPFHAPAKAALQNLVSSPQSWGIPVGCIHEFFAVVTNPRAFPTPTPVDHALGQIEVWLETPNVHLLHTGAQHLEILFTLIKKSKIQGSQIHDTRIAATCIENGANILWSADRDFSKFTHQLRHVNPLIT